MARRCPTATPVGLGLLDGYRFLINRAGVATVFPLPRGEFSAFCGTWMSRISPHWTDMKVSITIFISERP